MADERSKPPWSQPSPIPKGYDWPSLLAKDCDELFDHYRHTLEKLGAEKGTIGLIFAKALNKFQDPAKLRRLVVDLIDCENWSAMGADVKGDAYEGLLEKTKFQRRLTCTQVIPELKTRRTPRAVPANTLRRAR